MALCRTTLMRQLMASVPTWATDVEQRRLHLESHLHTLLTNQHVQAEVRADCNMRAMPLWHAQLQGTVVVAPYPAPYCVVGIDGSHIAPDHHAGLMWGLTNIGVCTLEYGASSSTMGYSTHPQVYQVPGTEQLLAQYRARDELLCVTECWVSRDAARRPALLMIDGPLIPEHGENGAWLEELCAVWNTHRIPVLGYVSTPHSGVLTGILTEFCKSSCAEYERYGRVHVPDSVLFSSFLPSAHRSTVWKLSQYVECTFVNVGLECVRIEFPVYLRQDTTRWDMLMQIVMDQVRKGFGYPRCLAEAHWQSLIREADRQFIIEQFLAAAGSRGHTMPRHGWSWSQGYGTSAKLARKKHIPM